MFEKLRPNPVCKQIRYTGKLVLIEGFIFLALKNSNELFVGFCLYSELYLLITRSILAATVSFEERTMILAKTKH